MRTRSPYILTSFILVLVIHAVFSMWRASRISEQWIQVESLSPVSSYFIRQDFYLSISYGLAGAFTVYAFLKFFQNRKSGATGVLGGITLAGVLYFGACFMVGCCGSPMLAVYLSLFGSSFLGFAKPLVLILTAASVVLGFIWIEKRTKSSDRCCP